MDTLAATLISVLVTAILGAIGYFLKRIFEKTENIGNDIAEIKPKVDILWKDKYAPALSPRQLNENGRNILNESGIKEIVDSYKDKLLVEVQRLNPPTAYDAEQAISSVVNDLPTSYPESVGKLKDGAFRMGQNIDALLLVGSIYLRDLIFEKLGFSLTDLDKPKL